MYCKNCGKEILEEFGTCPYCKTPIESNNQNNVRNNYNQRYNRNNPFVTFICFVAIIIGIILLYQGIKSNIDFAKHYNQHSSSTTKSTTSTPSTTTTKPTTTLKNYQQIYNEYSQKLVNAGPTSSINEMAQICNEGVSKMAQYMYSASGTDGQYATYQSWVNKLYDVYVNNCR